MNKSIPGAPEAINGLRKMGKSLHFVSNNSLTPFKLQLGRINAVLDETLDEEGYFTPQCAIIEYLKTLKFTKEIYVIGGTALKTALKEAGFTIAEDGVRKLFFL